MYTCTCVCINKLKTKTTQDKTTTPLTQVTSHKCLSNLGIIEKISSFYTGLMQKIIFVGFFLARNKTLETFLV